MDGKGVARVKVVWHEGNEARAVVCVRLDNPSDLDFMLFRLSDGRLLRLNRSAIIKLEEVP